MIFLLALICTAAIAALVCMVGYRVDANALIIRTDIKARDEALNRRFDDQIGELQKTFDALTAMQKPRDSKTSQKPKPADLFKVMDYETSQIAALDEFKDAK